MCPLRTSDLDAHQAADTYPTNQELARFFGISQRQVSNIFITRIDFASVQWSEIDIWPSEELVQHYCLEEFHAKFHCGCQRMMLEVATSCCIPLPLRNLMFGS